MQCPDKANHRVALLNHLPVRAGNSVGEEISLEHSDREGKPSGKAFCLSGQFFASLLEVAEEFVISSRR